MSTRFIPRIILAFLICLPLLSVAQTLFLPNTISDKRKGKEIKEEVAFFTYPYTGAEISLKDFKRKHPELKAPNTIKLKQTPRTYSDNVVVIIGLIHGVPATEEALIIWLAEDYNKNEVTFYIDKDLDRDFYTASEVKVLRPNDPDYPVKITPLRGEIPEQNLSLRVPRKRGEPIVNIPKKSKIYKQFAIGIHAGAGIGSLKYDYNNLEKGFPSWYSINFSSKGLGTSLSYSTAHLNVELSANYQNVFSYTSYLNVRFDNPEIRVDANGNRTRVENVQVERNFDRHSSNRLQYALNLGLRLHFSKSVEIQPYLGIGQTIFGKRQYIADRYDDTQVYTLDPMNFLQGGLRFEFIAKSNQTFFIDLYFQGSDWRPEGYFETIPHDNLRVDHRLWLFNFGYRIGL